jgi:hypothetical protein
MSLVISSTFLYNRFCAILANLYKVGIVLDQFHLKKSMLDYLDTRKREDMCEYLPRFLEENKGIFSVVEFGTNYILIAYIIRVVGYPQRFSINLEF